MCRESEAAFVNACIITGVIGQLARYYWDLRTMWCDRLSEERLDLKAAEYGLNVKYDGQTLLFYPASTRRKRPAFAAVSRGKNKYESDGFLIWKSGRFNIVGVEAKTHAILAGESKAAPARGQEESATLCA